MKIETAGSTVDHFLRQTRAHHVQLSGMADVKANMMLTVASVVLTLSVRYLTDPVFQWAALTLILFCVASIVAAIYSTMPRVPLPGPGVAKPHPSDPSYNPLFFGCFIHMTLEEYTAEMERVINNPSESIEMMVREVYSLGSFLAYRKFRYLRWAYCLFLIGLLASGVVQAACAILKLYGFHVWTIHLSVAVG